MNSEIALADEIKTALLAEAIKSAAFFSQGITEQQIIVEVERFLVQISAPDGLRGFYYVAQTLLQLFDTTGSSLQKQLALSDYLITALRVDLQLVISKAAYDRYINNSWGDNWAKLNPIYLVLFSASGLKSTNEGMLFLDAFIAHIVLNKPVLEDPEIQPSNRTRTEEVCRALRILQDKRQASFNVLQLADKIVNWQASEIARALVHFEQNNPLDKDTTRYLKILIRFFANDWPKPKLRGQIGPQKNKRQGGGKRVSARPELVASNIIARPALVLLDEDGVDIHDVEILRTHLAEEIEEDSERESYEQHAIAAIFDKDKQKLGSLNLTRSLRQKNNLNTSSRLLLSAASVRLLKILCENRLHKVEQNEAVMAIYCMFTTGISLTQLVNLNVITDEASLDNGIYFAAGYYYWRFKHRVSAITPVGMPEHFHRSDTWVKTPCSLVLSDYLNAKCIETNTKLFSLPELQLRKRIDKLLQRITEKLKAPYISIDMIESFVTRFTEATDTVDPVVLDFSYQQELFSTRVSRSYVNLSDLERNQMLQKLWCDIAAYSGDDSVSTYFQPAAYALPGLAQTDFAVTELSRVGSRYVPTDDFCMQFTQQLQTDLFNVKPGATLKLNQIISYHNAYIRYTTWMLGFGCGYRAVCNPLPTLTLHVPALQLLSISDKDDAVFSHSRVVAVADTLNQQLSYLRSHLVRLAELLALLSSKLFQQVREVLEMEQQLERMTKKQVEGWFKKIRNSKDLIGPLFYLDETLKARPVDPAWLKAGCGQFKALPVNMGRHWLKTALVTSGVSSELVNFQMGHWQEGQSPLFEHSSMSIMDSVAELAPQIEQLMAQQGWRACQSALL